MFYYEYPVILSSSSGTVNFNSTTTGSLVCEQAYIDQLDGWTNTAKVVVVSSQKAVGDGGYLANRLYLQPRLLTIGGLVAGRSELETTQAWYDLARYGFPLNKDITITHNGPIPMLVRGRVVSDLRVTQWNPTGFRYEIDLYCEDPYKYDVNIQTAFVGIAGNSTGGRTYARKYPLKYGTTAQGVGNVATLYNQGNANSVAMAVLIIGQVDQGWRLENSTTGEYLSFNISSPSTSQLLLDFKAQTATLDGVNIEGLINGSWWSLQPGVNQIRLYGNYYPNTTIVIEARSAWR